MALVLTAAIAISYQSFKLVDGPDNFERYSDTLRTYSNTGIQYQVLFEQMHTQLVRQSHDPNADYRTLQELNKAFQAAFAKLSNKPGDPFLDQMVPGYQSDLLKLTVLMDDTNDQLATIPKDKNAAAWLAGNFDKRRPLVTSLAQNLHQAETQYIKATFEAVDRSRETAAMMTQALGWAFIIAATFGAFMYLHLKARLEQRAKEVEASERETANARDASLAQNNFLAMIGHELRTPAQVIQNSIRFLDLRQADAPYREAMERLKSAARQFEALMRDLTDFARLDSGKLSLREAIFNPTDVVRTLIRNHQNAAESKGLRIVGEFGNSKVMIYSDEFRFQQIVTNLLTNAIKYSDKGNITIKLFFPPGDSSIMRLTVEDDGPGIRKEYLPHIFDPFTQDDQTNTRKHDGAGLGLSIVSRLVSLLGGNIKVTSEEGKGACFDVRIPVKIVKESTEKLSGASTKGETGAILIVDDKPEVRASLKGLLEHYGYGCEESADGHDALRRAATKAYAVILLDIQMPGIDGFEVAQRLRADAGPNRDVAIIAISGFPESFQSQDQRDAFTAYLEKPVTMDDLLPILEELTNV